MLNCTYMNTKICEVIDLHVLCPGEFSDAASLAILYGSCVRWEKGGERNYGKHEEYPDEHFEEA